MLIIFLIVLIMFGAKKLPELAKGLGQAVREFAKAKEDVNTEIHRAAHVETPVYHPPVEHGLPASSPQHATAQPLAPAPASSEVVQGPTVVAAPAPQSAPAQPHA
jgi:sec-independent protein translocase protein TatA